MMPLSMSAQSISKSIREKKKKMMSSPPDLIDTSPTPDLDAQDVYDLEQRGRIEGTLMSPEKINADVSNMESISGYDGVGVSPSEKKRLARLRGYMDGLPMWASNEKSKMMMK